MGAVVFIPPLSLVESQPDVLEKCTRFLTRKLGFVQQAFDCLDIRVLALYQTAAAIPMLDLEP